MIQLMHIRSGLDLQRKTKEKDDDDNDDDDGDEGGKQQEPGRLCWFNHNN
jgi:hypothetical protein